METKTSYFIVGLLLVGAIMVTMILIFTRGDVPIQEEDSERIFSTQDLGEIKSQTGNLENYGNLPNVLGAGDIGRENPFDSYK
jgi:hypothetical protein